MKITRIIMRVLLILMVLLPVLGTMGVFPPPTADLYSPAGWAFMEAMMDTGYMMPLIGVTFAAVLILTILNRMALAAIVMLPLTVNIVLFHTFLEGGLFSASAVLADILLILNAFFLWDNRAKYKTLW